MTFEFIAQRIGEDYSILFYVLVAIFACFESIPLFGVFFPGQILILLGGFLARLSGLNLITIILTAAIFAFIGEIYAFHMGKKHGFELIKKYGKYVFITKDNFNYIKNLIREHPAKAIILGRFNSLIRALSPFIAGASDLKTSRFIKYSLLGSLLWAVTFTLIGYIFAESYKAVANSISVFIVTATLIVIAILIGYRFMNKRKHTFSKTDFYKLIAGIISLYAVAKLAEAIRTNEKWIIGFEKFIGNLKSHLLSFFKHWIGFLFTGDDKNDFINLLLCQKRPTN